MPVPEFWIIAGPNGAGKTTLAQQEPIRQLLPDVTALNPDDRTLEMIRQAGFPTFADAPAEFLRQSFLSAADWVLREAAERVRRNEVIAVETVLSTDKYRAIVEDVQSRGGVFGLFYVALRTPELAQARVEQRVRLGGHGVPPERIAARWHRSLDILPWFAARANRLVVFDNTDSNPDNPPRLLATGINGNITTLEPDAIPEITAALSRATTA